MPAASKKLQSKESLIYVIAGQDETLVSDSCRGLLEQMVEPSQMATAVFSPQVDSIEICEVLDELRTAPFLSDKRVVVIKQAEAFISKNRELLEKYFDNPCSTGRLILTVKTWDARTRLAKKLSTAGTLISITPPKRWDIPKLLSKYATDKHNKSLNRNAAELIVELTGEEPARLYNEIDKLALFVDNRKEIKFEDVQSLLDDNRLFNVFAVIDAVITGDAAISVNRLRAMFEADKSAEYTVIGAFAFHIRRMFKAKVMLEKGTSWHIIEKRLAIWSNKEQFFAQLRQIPLRQIGFYLQQLAETDYEIKTGRANAKIAVEQFVLKLCENQQVNQL